MINPTVVYIAGYGRSGSTLLERLLNTHSQIFGAGELVSLHRVLSDDSSTCACGSELNSCSIWSSVLSCSKLESKDNANSWVRMSRYDTVRALLKFIYHGATVGKDDYRRLQHSLFTCLAGQESTVSMVIDSSKTARNAFFRPLALKNLAGLEVKVIHLVRDGRACMVSNLKGSNQKMEFGLQETRIPFAAFRTVLSWPIANLGAHLFQLFSAPEDYCRIRYEDLFDQPDQTLREVADLLDLDLSRQSELIRNREPIPVGHQLSGNRLRSQPDLILMNDETWKGKLSFWQHFLFWFFDWPFAWLYGYLKVSRLGSNKNPKG